MVPGIREGQAAAASSFLLDTISSFRKFASRLLKVQTKQGDLIDYDLNEVQDLMERIVNHIRSRRRRVRVVILKARRKGISTWISGRFFYKTVTNRNRYSMIVTHEPEATDFVFKMHKRFQDNLPDFFKPEERYNNKKMLEFNTQDGSGLDSAIRVGTAGKEDLGSGQLIHYLHLSELAKWARHITKNLLLSLLQCVPDTADSEVFMESTAKGVGGEFYTRFWGSRYYIEFSLSKEGKIVLTEKINREASEDNIYTSVFIPWFVFYEYQKEPSTQFLRTKEEQELAERHNLTDRHLMWRRWAVENQCNGNVSLFNQEYPTTAEEAFLSSNDNIFDVKQLKHLMMTAPPPRQTYTIQLTTGNFLADANGKLQVWDEPIPIRRYLISADVAEGITSGDFSSVDVVDTVTGVQAAHWRGHIPPGDLGRICLYLAYRYNQAWIAVERNNHGLTTIDTILNAEYRRVYAEMVVEPPQQQRKRYGWLTSKVSKPRIIDNLAEEMRNNTHGIRCKETFQEMMFFKQFEDGTLGAEEGQKDDRVLSYAIGKYLRTKLPTVRKTLAFQFRKPYANKRQDTAVRPGAWT